MKKIIKYITFLAVSLFIAAACDYDDSNFENLTISPDPNATYFVQFKGASKSLKTDVNPNTGDLVDINASVVVALMGMPQSQDISVNLSVDPSTTVTSDQYELSSNTLTIPAGKSAGSVNFKAIASKMAINEPVSFVLNMDAGANTASVGTQLKYDLLRICAQDPSSIKGNWTLDMKDSYGDGWNGATVTVKYGNTETVYTIEDGASGFETITIPDGTLSVKFFFASGDWDEEVTFEITAPNGIVVGSGGPTPAVGEINIDACKL